MPAANVSNQSTARFATSAVNVDGVNDAHAGINASSSISASHGGVASAIAAAKEQVWAHTTFCGEIRVSVGSQSGQHAVFSGAYS